MKNASMRFLKYFVVGFSTFAFDLFLLYILTDVFFLNYVFSAGLAFLIAVSVNYYFSRRFVFAETKRGFAEGYVGFIAIACIGLVCVTGLMAFFVEIFHWDHIFARIVVAAVVGIWNYSMNLFVNFKVAGTR